MIDINPNIHIDAWYKDWLPRTSTHELKRLLTTPYGKDPAVRRRLEGELASRDQDRPVPSPGKPRPVPRAVKATAASIASAAKKRDELGPEPEGLALAIVMAGKKRRGEI